MNVTALIPARAGSKRVRRKNLQPIAGKPMVAHAIDACLACPEVGRVVVTTDDAAVGAIARLRGVEVLDRPAELADDAATVDQVVEWAFPQLGGPLLVVQPTMPQITADMLARFLAAAENFPAVMAHGTTELGVRYVTGPGWRCADKHYHQAGPLVDVDTPGDLAAARQHMETRRVVFRVVANRNVGSGHIHRCLALADRLQHHQVEFAVHGDNADLWIEPWVHDLLDRSGYVTTQAGWDHEPGVLVNDTLDTLPAEFAAPIAAGWRIVSLEDHGPGARHADLVVNAMYPAGVLRERNGAGWCVLRPEFLSVPEREIREVPVRVLVTFGGTDPAGLTERLFSLFVDSPPWSTDGPQVRLIEPPGKPDPRTPPVRARIVEWAGWQDDVRPVSMVEELAAADLVICSAGRTVYEAAAVGTPAIVLGQNVRETTHSHLGLASGNVWLGLGRMVTDDQIVETVRRVLGDVELRRDLSVRGRRLVDGLGADRIVHEVEGLLRGL